MKLASCHPERKMQARELCKPCYDKWLKSVNPGYRNRQLSNTTLWKQKNPDKYRLCVQRRLAKEKNDPTIPLKKRNRRLKLKYGISHNEYENMLLRQSGGCALCTRSPKTGKRLHIDHDHKTGKVRGLLCHQCNWYLGTVEASPGLLEKIKVYLEA